MLGRLLMQDWVFLLSELAAQVAAAAAMFLVWRGLRAAGLRADAFLLVALILLVLSPALIQPGAFFILPPFLSPAVAEFYIPLFAPLAVAFFIYRGLAGTGLAPRRAAIVAIVGGLLLLAAAALKVAGVFYVESHHVLG